MAVEIFSAAPSTGAVSRAYGSELLVKSPSDVYFGKGAPGIAYFEKAGADLRVTLLDGQEVMLRDFFVIGPDGSASRLLDSPSGPVEVTGLIAPEPFQPESGVIHPAEAQEVKPAESAPAPSAHPAAGEAGAASTGAETEAASAPDAAPNGTETSDAAGTDTSGGLTLFGAGLDKLLFSSALGVILGEIITSSDDDNHKSKTSTESTSETEASTSSGATDSEGTSDKAVTETSATATSQSATTVSNTDADSSATTEASTTASDSSASDAASSSSTDATSAAETVASLISSDSSTIDLTDLKTEASTTSTTVETTESGLGGGMLDSADTGSTETDSTVSAGGTTLDDSFAELMQGSDDVSGA